MIIDKHDGSIHLPNGFVITPALTRSQFEASPVFHQAKIHVANEPFVSFNLRCGDERHPEMITVLYFYEELLTSLSLTTYIYATSWDGFSMEGEIKTKAVHDELLRQDLGEPHKVENVHIADAHDTNLETWPHYTFAWGVVSSGHDQRASATHIHIAYGDRQKWALRDYQRKHTPSRLARLRNWLGI